MGKRGRSLIALVYQHLLQNGYAKSARELQIESGEQFVAQTISLKEIYMHWNKSGEEKRRKLTKKPRVQDPASPSESSDADAKETSLVAQGKKGSSKKVASKIKAEPVTPKRMNSSKKSASKVKGTPKVETPSQKEPETPATLAESSDDSDSEEETVPAKTSLKFETSLKSTPAADLKSKSTSTTGSEAAQHNKNVSAKSAPASAVKKPVPASNGKAADKSDTSESESSDETDIEKQPVAVTPSLPAPSSTQGSKGKSETPSTVTQPKSDSSESESEEEPAVKQKVPTPATPPVKTAMPSAKTTAAQVRAAKGKSITKAKDVTPASQGSAAVKLTPARVLAQESSEESDSDDELVPSTLEASVPSSVAASKQKVQPRPSTLQAKAGDSSSSESESEEEPVKQNQKKPASPKKGAKLSTRGKAASAQASKPNAAVPPKAEDSESSSDSSDSEAKATEKTVSLPPSLGKGAPSTAATTPVQAAPPADSSESDDSDSDEEPAPTKPSSLLPAANAKSPSTSVTQPVAAIKAENADDTSETEDSDSSEDPEKTAGSLPASGVKTPSTGAKHPVAAAVNASGRKARPSLPVEDASETDSDSDEPLAKQMPTPAIATPKTKAVTKPANVTPTIAAAKTKAVTKPASVTPASLGIAVPAWKVDDESSEDSDSDEPTPAVKASGPTPVTPPAKPSAAATALVPDSDADSESSDSSDSEDIKTVLKANASQTKAVPKLATPVGKSTAPGKASAEPKPSLVDQSSESSESEEEEKLQPAVVTPKPTIAAKGKQGIPAASQPDSSSEDSESETTEPVKPTPQVLKTKSKAAASLKTSATPLTSAKKKTPASGKVAQKASVDPESSDFLSGVEDLPLSKTLKGTLSSRKKAAKLSPLPRTSAKNKAGSPAKAVTGTKPAAVDESSSSGDSSESSEGPADTLKKKDVAALVKHLLTSTQSITIPVKGKAALPAKSPVAVNTAPVLDSESESESDEETKQVSTPAPTPAKAVGKKGKGKATSPSKAETVKSAGGGKTGAQKQEIAETSSHSSQSNSSDEKAKKVAPKTPKTPRGKLLDKTQGSTILATPKTKVTSLTKAPAPLKAMPWQSSSESSDSEDDQATKKTKAAVTKQGKSLPAAKLKSASPVKTPVVSAPIGDESSDVSSDSDEEEAVKEKVANNAAGKTNVPSKSPAPEKDSSSSEPEESQSLLQPRTPTTKLSTKRKRTEGKTASVTESVTKPSKKKPKVQAQPKTKPTPSAPSTPGGLLESEEETVLALLEGRSPKKAKKPPKKNPVAETIQEKSLPPALSTWVPDSPSTGDEGGKDAKSPAVPDLGNLSATKEKSGKKRKSSSGDGLATQKDKKAKKAKKEKKEKKAKAEAEILAEATPKSSKKEKKKAEKDKKKKEDKEKKKQKKKESKKLAQSPVTPVGESTDSGVSLQSKPTKKKKVKGDKKTA